MSTKANFLAAAYLVSFALCIGFGILQQRAFHRWSLTCFRPDYRYNSLQFKTLIYYDPVWSTFRSEHACHSWRLHCSAWWLACHFRHGKFGRDSEDWASESNFPRSPVALLSFCIVRILNHFGSVVRNDVASLQRLAIFTSFRSFLQHELHRFCLHNCTHPSKAGPSLKQEQTEYRCRIHLGLRVFDHFE